MSVPTGTAASLTTEPVQTGTTQERRQHGTLKSSLRRGRSGARARPLSAPSSSLCIVARSLSPIRASGPRGRRWPDLGGRRRLTPRTAARRWAARSSGVRSRYAPRRRRSTPHQLDTHITGAATPEFLAVCAKAYRPPTFVSTDAERSRRLWIIGTDDADPPGKDADLIARGEGKARAKVSDGRRFEVDWIHWAGTDSFTQGSAIGDLVIVVHKDRDVYPHARLVNIERVRGARYVYLETLKGASPRRWLQFRAKLELLGFPRLGKTISQREVKDSAMRSRLTSLMSPDRWTT